MLSGRRRQLGLSIAQASRVLKLKEQVLIAFEEGDWDRIPRSGYAQGMLSSYARYLGLNPRDVIDQFQSDLMLYTSGQDRYKDPYDTGVGAPHARTSQGYPTPNSGYGKDKDLYGSAGPAGSILTGHELGQPRRSTRSIPLASSRNAGYSERYLRQQQQTSEREAAALASSQYPQGRPYTARAPQRSSDRTAATRRNYERAGMRTSGGESGRDITTRRVTSADYDDDLTYAQARPYEQASSREGRRASRNIAEAQRPNVKRRGSESTRRDMQRRTTRQQKSGVAGVIEAFFSSRTRTIVTIFAMLAIIIILVVVMSVKSCTSTTVADEAKASVAVSAGSTTSTDTTSSSTASTDEKDDASSTAAADEEDTSPVTVTVTVGSGEVSWLEITNGDKSLVAETVSGPWEQTYTVDGTMTIEASDITAVTVLKNGTQVPFDERASGVGSITIEGPKATASEADEADAQAEDVDAGTTDDASDSTSSSSTKSNTSATSDSTSKSTASTTKNQ
jgi:cytoskeletal protein RodZ